MKSIKPKVTSTDMKNFSLRISAGVKRIPLSLELEITARCNLNCKHCYINLRANDEIAKRNELSKEDIKEIIDESISLGAISCTLTGGEPLLRGDFIDIYLYLKKKGILVSVFTNATLITKEIIDLFKSLPPRIIEVSVYGKSKEIYERITRQKGSYFLFNQGLELLLDSGLKIRLKGMALRSNVKELEKIEEKCKNNTYDFHRIDPFLHLRYDQDIVRNTEIKMERLTPSEIVEFESSNKLRYKALIKHRHRFITKNLKRSEPYLFYCTPGRKNFAVSYDGKLRLCPSLWHPDTIYDLKNGTIFDAWTNFIPFVLRIKSNKKVYIDNCLNCPISNLCFWCPAHAFLESGEMDTPVDYFCNVAKARAKMIENGEERI